MTASLTVLPVLGVPVQSQALNGLDSLLSIVQMPGGVPVGTLAIGKAGAINAAAFGGGDPGEQISGDSRTRARAFREASRQKVMAEKVEEGRPSERAATPDRPSKRVWLTTCGKSCLRRR